MIDGLAGFGRFWLFVGTFLLASAVRPPPIARSIEEAYKIGVRSLPILLIISTFVGTNLALQGFNAFKPLGGQRLVGMFVALAGVREMAPIMVAAMVAAKAGTEMASQIAVMRIREQIDALEVMAINPHWFLITPRFMGILLVLPALTILSIFTLLVSSYTVSVYQLGLSGEDFLSYVMQSTHVIDFWYCTIKSFAFGIIICLVSCYFGFESKPGPSGVGAATNAAVVVSACLCAALNYLLSEILYG
jgi:phospholipid/cholesterol/gamma-HCH transport system permease protein